MVKIARKDLRFFIDTQTIVENFMDCPEKVFEVSDKVKLLAARLRGNGHKIQLSYDSFIPHCLEISSNEDFRAVRDFESHCEKLGMNNIFI